MAKLGKIASECGIEVLGLECLNRFENHVLNTAAEGVSFVKSVRELEPKASNVSVMLDTFHMNIEESIGATIRTAGSLLGHFLIPVSATVWFRAKEEHLGGKLGKHFAISNMIRP